MRLERSSLFTVLACVVSLVLLAVLGARSLQELARERNEIQKFRDLQERLFALSNAADAFLLVAPEPDQYPAFELEALALRQALAAVPDPAGRLDRVGRHIEQLHSTLAAVVSTLPEGTQPAVSGSSFASGETPPVSALVAIRNGRVGISEAFSDFLRERQSGTYARVRKLLATFLFATGLFGLICVASFAYIHRRITVSISLLANSVEQVRSSESDLRLPALRRRDEVGALSAAINRLLDRQADAMRKIEEQRMEIRQQSGLLIAAGEIARVGGWSLMLGEEHVSWSDVVAEIHGKPHGYRPSLSEAIAFYLQDDQIKIRDAFTACVERALPYDLQLQIRNDNEELRWVRTAGKAVCNEQGRVIGVQGAVQDITGQMETEEQLRRVQRLESIGQLTGGIAHDFNNILTVILGNSELLLETIGGDEALLSLTRMIRDSADRGARLTNQLLAFARRQTLRPQQADLNGVLDGIHDVLDSATGQNVILIQERTENLGLCELDIAQLENALLNLAINARDAMPDGGTLTIRTANYHHAEGQGSPLEDMPPGDYVALSVRDTGSGMPAADLARAFEPFYTTKPTGRGTGLGLPMVYGFVKQSAGFIDITSKVGEGTNITLYFPRVEGTPVRPEQASSLDGPLPRSAGKCLILLVEDDDLVRRYVEQQLSSLGYAFVSASGGAEALAVLRSRDDIDLLFTDLVMPGGINGRELADIAIRERPYLRILYTSGYAQDIVAENGDFDEGAELLRKPYRREELASRLASILDGR